MFCHLELVYQLPRNDLVTSHKKDEHVHLPAHTTFFIVLEKRLHYRESVAPIITICVLMVVACFMGHSSLRMSSISAS